MSRATDVKEIKIACLIRHYVYVATVSNKTGKLLHIRAGCRSWKTFAEAQRHYNGMFGAACWHDAQVNTDVVKYAQRWEARAVLSRLDTQVISTQRKIRQRLKRAAL